MKICRTLLQQSAQLHNTGPVGAIVATYFERSPASRSYCTKTKYDVKDLKVTKIVDTETNAILNLHCTTTREGSDAEICKQLARKHAGELQALTADKGYDCTWLREYLQEDLGVRPLIKHCINKPYDSAHNARIDDDIYRRSRPSASGLDPEGEGRKPR